MGTEQIEGDTYSCANDTDDESEKGYPAALSTFRPSLILATVRTSYLYSMDRVVPSLWPVRKTPTPPSPPRP